MKNPVSSQPHEHKRPALLTVLCILTFIFSGSAMILSLMGIFASGWLLETLETFVPGIFNYSSSFLIVFFLVLVLIWGLSLWGSILMFGLRKGGFVMYLIPNGLLLIVQTILTISTFNVFFLLFLLISILFIILYATQVKYMKE